MTQHDSEQEQGSVDLISDSSSSTSRPEDVTRQQEGQFSMESESISGPPEDAIEADQDARLEDDGAHTINALQVTMERSGAEHIHAQKAFLTNSGAKSIDGRSSKLTQSGVLQLKTDKAELHQSSAVLVSSDEIQLEGSSVVLSISDKAVLNHSNTVVMQAGSIEAAGDIRAFMMLGNDIKAGGSVESTMNLSSAAVFGAAFGAVFALIWKMIRGNARDGD